MGGSAHPTEWRTRGSAHENRHSNDLLNSSSTVAEADPTNAELRTVVRRAWIPPYTHLALRFDPASRNRRNTIRQPPRRNKWTAAFKSPRSWKDLGETLPPNPSGEPPWRFGQS